MKKDFCQSKELSLPELWALNMVHDCGAITSYTKMDNSPGGEGRLFSEKENQQRDKTLRIKLINLEYLVVEVRGTMPGCEVGSPVSCYFVADHHDRGELSWDITALGEYFYQGSVLLVPKSGVNNVGEGAYLYGTSHSIGNKIGYGEKFFLDKNQWGGESTILTGCINGNPLIFDQVQRIYGMPGTGYGVWGLRVLAQMDWWEIKV